MTRMAEAAAGTPGLIEIGPWLEYGGDRVVGFSRWKSREAFEAAMPGSGVPNDTIHDGERRPREYFHLTQRWNAAGGRKDAVPTARGMSRMTAGGGLAGSYRAEA